VKKNNDTFEFGKVTYKIVSLFFRTRCKNNVHACQLYNVGLQRIIYLGVLIDSDMKYASHTDASMLY